MMAIKDSHDALMGLVFYLTSRILKPKRGGDIILLIKEAFHSGNKTGSRAGNLKAFLSNGLLVFVCQSPKMRPKPNPVWWLLHVHLEDSLLFCIHQGENSTLPH